MLLLHFGSFRYVATSIWFALTYGSSFDWDELSAEQLLSSFKNAKYLALVEPLSVFLCFLSVASPCVPSIWDSFLFWPLFSIVLVSAATTNWTSNNSAWSASLHEKSPFLNLGFSRVATICIWLFWWNWNVFKHPLCKNIDYIMFCWSTS